jgi:hypothetical protein
VADSSQSADSFPYPSGSVVGVAADDAAVDETRRRLTEADFSPDRYEVLHGEAGLARIDVEGAGHGRSGRLKRLLQDALSDDENHVRRYAEHLREGHYVIGVKVGDDDAAKRRAAEALGAADAQFVHYYAENYVEDL